MGKLSNISNKAGGEPIPQGVFPARLIGVIDLGKQESSYKGKTTQYDKVMLMFEFPQTGEVNGVKFHKTLVTEMATSVRAMPKPSNLYKVFSALDAKADVRNASNFLGKYLYAQVGRTSGDKAKIINYMPLPAGLPVHESTTQPLLLDLDAIDLEAYKKLPAFIQNKIKEGVSYAGSEAEAAINSLPIDTSETDDREGVI